MRIAVPADGSGLEAPVAAHFGRCAALVVVDVEDNEIAGFHTVENPYAAGHAPGQMPALVREQGASVIIAGGMGPRAVGFFEQFGIDVATGATGTVRDAVRDYLAGRLSGAQPCHEGGDCSDHEHRHGPGQGRGFGRGMGGRHHWQGMGG